MRKQMKNFFKHRNIQHLLIILFLFLLLPLILICFLAINSANKKIIENSLSSFEQSLDNIGCTVDTQLWSAYTQGSNLCSFSRLTALSSFPEQLSDYDRITSINSVNEILSIIKENNSLIDNIQVHVPALKRTINANGYKHGSLEILEQADFDQLLSRRETGEICCLMDDQLNYLIMSSYTNPPNLVRIVFSGSSISKYLSMFITMENEDLFLLTSDGNLIAGTDSSINLPQVVDSEQTELYHGNKRYWVFTRVLEDSGLVLLCMIDPESIYYSAYKTTIYSTLILLIMLLCIAIFSFAIWYMIRQPLYRLINAFQEMEGGNLLIRIPDNSITEFSSLYTSFNHMANHMNELIEKEYKQKLLLQEAELKQLQAQINPHFLYNSFFLLQRLIQCELTQDASELSRKLGIYFRYVTRCSNQVVALKEEYEHAHIYMDIQTMRFEKRIQIYCAPLPEEYALFQIPKLVLQPVLENAFKYGLSDKTEDGILALNFISDSAECLQIVIEDNGSRLTQDNLHRLQEDLRHSVFSDSNLEMTGLLNIAKRLSIFSGSKNSLKADRSKLGGLKITMNLEDTNVSITDC